MRYFDLSVAISLAVITTLALAAPSFAYDDLGTPPPEPAGAVIKPLTNESIQVELDQRLVDRFEAAAGSSPRLTAQQAKDAGWGFVSDHFGEIDKRNNGYVSLDEIQSFIDARSLGNPAEIRAKAKAATTAIQKIE